MSAKSKKSKASKVVEAVKATVAKVIKCDALNVGHRSCKCPDCLAARGE